MPYYLGLDNGTSGTKALLITAEGTPVASDTQEYPLSTPRPLWAEQDPADWWDAAVQATRNVLEKSGVRAEEIAGVGLSGQMHGSVFLDKDNTRPAARPALVRPAHPGRVRLDHGPGRAREPRQVHQQPGPDGVHGPQDRLAAEP